MFASRSIGPIELADDVETTEKVTMSLICLSYSVSSTIRTNLVGWISLLLFGAVAVDLYVFFVLFIDDVSTIYSCMLAN